LHLAPLSLHPTPGPVPDERGGGAAELSFRAVLDVEPRLEKIVVRGENAAAPGMVVWG